MRLQSISSRDGDGVGSVVWNITKSEVKLGNNLPERSSDAMVWVGQVLAKFLRTENQTLGLVQAIC